jgi:hypothetical protein
MLVERVLLGARGVVGNNSEGAFVGNRLAEMVGVIGSVGDDDLGGGSQMDLGAQAATRASDGLIRSPLFAPLACW